jgi:hypothetical protein
VILDVRDEETLIAAIMQLSMRARQRQLAGALFLLQQMARKGREVILGGKQDPSFGPVALFGLGGIYVEALGDVSLGLAPLDRDRALAMIDRISGARLLGGLRGEPPADREAIADALVRISCLLSDFREIKEIDLNPLIVYPQGTTLVDARIVKG